MKKILLALAAVVALGGVATACDYGNLQALVAQQNVSYNQTYGYVAPLQLNVGYGYRQNVQFLNTGYGYNNVQNVRVVRQFVAQPVVQKVVVQKVIQQPVVVQKIVQQKVVVRKGLFGW